MGIEKGSRVGPYEIVGQLGAGGMGEVYRARDSRLGRDVAIKALPEEFARDPDRLARFEREARLLASLHHANIAGIHGLEEIEGHRYLVLECVEGETLAERIRRGPIPVDETIDIARAVAAALEAAHESGIVHRDLKPGNVMLTHAGDVKVLDFGLAKGGSATSPTPSDPGVSASPTLTYAGTEAGVILGTAAYMSPEQARGRAVDRRTDIWSFGCLVFECLTGRQTFAGETVSDIVARILQGEPAWDSLPARTPERLRALLHRCLEKDVKRRQRDIGDARIELEDLRALSESSRMARATSVSRARNGLRRLALAAVAVVAVAAATWFTAAKWNGAPTLQSIQFEVPGPKHRDILLDAAGMSLSPDGRWLAMIVTDSSFTPSIWLRRMDSITPRELPGTRNATMMFWSPDSKFLAFFAGDQQLSKIPIAGGEPERICRVQSARGGTWNREGVILLAPYSNGGIYRVSANGGEPAMVARPDSTRGETGYRFPHFLPDGKHFLFTSVPAGADGMFGLYVGALDGSAPKPLDRVESGVLYRDPGWVLTTRDNAVVARRFDARARKLRGEPVKLDGAPLAYSQYSGGPVIAASQTGVLSYLTRTIPVQRLDWIDLDGRQAAIPGLSHGLYYEVKVSPDGRRALLGGVSDDFKQYVAIVDLERGTASRVTGPTEDAGSAVWSPDGRRIAFQVGTQLVIHSLEDGSRRTLLASDRAYKRLQEWSRDGRSLVIERLDPHSKWDVWLVPVEGDSTPQVAARSPANEQNAKLSPDGRWVAFTSDETGTGELYVQAVGSAGLKYQVTTGGGGAWYWSRDGKSLAFQRSDRSNVLYRAAVTGTDEIALGPPSAFMKFPEDLSYASPDPDEKRFLVLRAAEKPERQTITVVQNWESTLRRP